MLTSKRKNFSKRHLRWWWGTSTPFLQETVTYFANLGAITSLGYIELSMISMTKVPGPDAASATIRGMGQERG